MERRNSWELEDLDSESISSPYSLNSSFLMRLKGDESVFFKAYLHKKYYSAESISSINIWIPNYSHVFCK